MPKYLFIGSYTADGARGLLKDGGTKRREVADRIVQSVGGTLESYHFGFGADDFYLIADLPDHSAAAAVSLTAGGSGAITSRTVVLLTPEDIDAAGRHSVSYTAPGQT